METAAAYNQAFSATDHITLPQVADPETIRAVLEELG